MGSDSDRNESALQPYYDKLLYYASERHVLKVQHGFPAKLYLILLY